MLSVIGPRRKRTKGHAVLELVLMSPWILLLFAGAMDMGFYSYALIATQNAARVAAEATSYRPGVAADSSLACQMALPEMTAMSNARSLTSCGSAPLIVAARSFNDPDGALATEVTVTYTTVSLFPIPGLARQFTISKAVTMRVL